MSECLYDYCLLNAIQYIKHCMHCNRTGEATVPSKLTIKSRARNLKWTIKQSSAPFCENEGHLFLSHPDR